MDGGFSMGFSGRARLLMVCLLGLGATQAAGAADRFRVLHEVLRHYEVAFVDRVNMGALLMGGLYGAKTAAPEADVVLQLAPQMFRIVAKGKVVDLPAAAVSDFKGLEAALRSVGSLLMDQGLVKSEKEIEHAMIRSLVSYCGDPWSVFLEEDLYSRLLDDGTVAMGEAGLLPENMPGGLRVLDATDGMSAFRAGIRQGMRIEEVGGRPASKLSELEALAMLRGKVGGKVDVKVDGKAYALEFTPEPKRNIEVDTLDGGVARVHLLNFRAETGKRLAELLPKIEAKVGGHLKGLVLDLRGNPGGLLTEGTEVVKLFIGGGRVVSVKSQKQMREEVEESSTMGEYRKLPLVVLVDHRSASVSEIVALALRDYERAKLVGGKTLGKGTVQVVMELLDGSALKLSTGRYYSPKGHPLYEGLEPDVEVEWNGTGEDVQLKQAMKLLR
jgi:C-terminal peptidase prc